MKQIFKHNQLLMRISVAFLVVLLMGDGISLFAQQQRNIRIGQFKHWYLDVGSTRFRSTDGQEWPAQWEEQDHHRSRRFYIGVTDYTDHEMYGGETYNYKTLPIGVVQLENTGYYPISMKMIARYPRPDVTVDGLFGTDLMFTDNYDEVDPTLESDRKIINVVNTQVGITMTRIFRQWEQEYHDNYVIKEYIFKNTGNVDDDPEIEQETDITGFYMYLRPRWTVNKEASERTGLRGATWSRNSTSTHRGEAKEAYSTAEHTYPGDYEDYLNGDMDADSIRCMFTWFGYHSGAEYDNLGGPDVPNETGRLTSGSMIGVATLHADASTSDTNDDPQQPTTTLWIDNDLPLYQNDTGYDATQMAQQYADIAGGHMLPRHDEALDGGYADIFQGTIGGISCGSAWGPYDIAHGDSIRIVIVEGADGIRKNYELTEEVGAKWYQAYLNQSQAMDFEMADGSIVNGTYNDGTADAYKNSYVWSMEDSLMQMFSRAQRNFDSGYDIPTAPPPPDQLEVTSQPDFIHLEWSSNAESASNFSGYKVYRATAKYDTTYDMIFECGPGTANPTVVNSYQDESATRGFAYYYYVSSVSDGSNNPPGPNLTNPPGELESNMMWTRTTSPANLLRQPGASLDDIRVVPNPFNLRAKVLQYPGEQDKIQFLNIPGQCTIKIYTERGDLIDTIEHTDGSGDQPWLSRTMDRQVVVSGVYIAVIETPDGDQAMRKFVIIR